MQFRAVIEELDPVSKSRRRESCHVSPEAVLKGSNTACIGRRSELRSTQGGLKGLGHATMQRRRILGDDGCTAVVHLPVGTSCLSIRQNSP